MKAIETHFKIQGGKLVFLNPENPPELQELIEQNEGRRGVREIRIEEDSVKYSQHKYYRGYLIPPIARGCFDGDEFKAHIEMKKRFLCREVHEYAEIPRKRQGRCIPIWKITPDGEELLIGYLPSTGDLTEREMREYIILVEQFSFDMAMNAIPEEGIPVRNAAFGYDPGQSSLF